MGRCSGFLSLADGAIDDGILSDRTDGGEFGKLHIGIQRWLRKNSPECRLGDQIIFSIRMVVISASIRVVVSGPPVSWHIVQQVV